MGSKLEKSGKDSGDVEDIRILGPHTTLAIRAGLEGRSLGLRLELKSVDGETESSFISRLMFLI